MQILRAADHRRMPWKNGGGETTEIMVWPQGAGLDNFGWRVSMARVTQDGPFSAFPGIDRTLAILEGEGLRLEISGQPPIELGRTSTPHSFPADAETGSALLRGPVTDLNVMTRRGSFSHRLTRLENAGQLTLGSEIQRALLLCSRGTVSVQIDGQMEELSPLDCALATTSAAWEKVHAENTEVYLIEIIAQG
ncbi:HutD family protein [Mesorhizobium sp. NBSH29]|uniref:HutD/Ves family protein n=1 Tax=Mesorhizobium sp. NBSH29 TaxID=2654249 RepID=UPI001896680E|nr:HutD family protein [Mesorhizobium sp. NBSH29]QPC86913.1 HutD family protein [Mesorhizobium sp. NBSH29]